MENTTEFQDTLILKLIKPVTIGDITISELNLREPIANEIARAQGAGGTSVDVAISLISQVTAVSREQIGRLCQRDFMAANDFLGSFSATSPKTGEAATSQT